MHDEFLSIAQPFEPAEHPLPTDTIHALTPPDSANEQSNDESHTMSANLSFELLEIAANPVLYAPNDTRNLSVYAKVLESPPLNTSDLVNAIVAGLNDKDRVKRTYNSSKKPQRTKTILNEFPVVIENIAAVSLPEIDDISDDDFEIDHPCNMDGLILSNLNNHRNADDTPRTKCTLCDFDSTGGWKQLTKHCVRHHQGMDIPSARLSKNYNPQELMQTTFTPILSNGLNGMLIKSLCYICNQGYNMHSEKWMMHFVAHTGE